MCRYLDNIVNNNFQKKLPVHNAAMRQVECVCDYQ